MDVIALNGQQQAPTVDVAPLGTFAMAGPRIVTCVGEVKLSGGDPTTISARVSADGPADGLMLFRIGTRPASGR